MSTLLPARNPWAGALKSRRVLVTGHTGFKGSWLSLWLSRIGANVIGCSLPPASSPALFDVANVRQRLHHIEADIRDFDRFSRVWNEANPEVVFHLAAQAIVRASYVDPLTTVTTNTLGTAHVLELARRSKSNVALVVITSDKCYENHEWDRGYAETDRLGGIDVYSGSKAAAEILVSSYRRSFSDGKKGVASARAGNVIGGGDWSKDRIVPDAIAALCENRPIVVRSPSAVRPWQHVLEPLSGYLTLASGLLSSDACVRNEVADCWNFGPTIENTRTVGELVTELIAQWGTGTWFDGSRSDQPHEAGLLRLDVEKARERLNWAPRWSFAEAVTNTVAWHKAYAAGANMAELCEEQIARYEDVT